MYKYVYNKNTCVNCYIYIYYTLVNCKEIHTSTHPGLHQSCFNINTICYDGLADKQMFYILQNIPKVSV